MRNPNPSNEKGTCLWCGRKLIHEYTYEQEEFEMEYEDPVPHWFREKRGLSSESRVVKGMRSTDVKIKRYENPGPYGDGFFCSLRCGYQFGKTMAYRGARLRTRE